MDIKASGCANVLNTLWMWGYETKFSGTGVTPNGLAMWKFLAAGEVTWLIFETKVLVPALKISLGKDKLSITEVYTYLEDVGEKSLQELSDTGAKPFYAVQSSNTMLFVPVGFIALEKCTKGVLVYGLRRTCVIREASAVANYEELMGTYVCDGRSTDKMKVALDLMKLDPHV